MHKPSQTWLSRGGPVAIVGIIAAIPLVITTGPVGAGLIAAAAASAGVATSTIVPLFIAIGGVIAIIELTEHPC
jgi:hypothetical protein